MLVRRQRKDRDKARMELDNGNSKYWPYRILSDIETATKGFLEEYMIRIGGKREG